MDEAARIRTFGDHTPVEGLTDRDALNDRIVTGCQYRSGLCACPAAPYAYEGCLARHLGEQK